MLTLSGGRFCNCVVASISGESSASSRKRFEYGYEYGALRARLGLEPETPRCRLDHRREGGYATCDADTVGGWDEKGGGLEIDGGWACVGV